MKELRRVYLEGLENQHLAGYAAKASLSAGRSFTENEDDYRTCYQRDRDRIIYSTAFKNLQFKTQVFVAHEGDYYRTRLTHTLEVMQHAQTFARVLRVNADLVEAIALAHDLGHAPFGHAGEEVLAELFLDYGGFDHNLHSLKVVDLLEERYPDFPGLNLTWETREGLARHLTRYDHPQVPSEFQLSTQPGIEAQIVNAADSLAFAAHDLDDALRIGLVAWEELNELPIPIIQEIVAEIKLEEAKKGCFSLQMRVSRLVRQLINYFNIDCLVQSEKNLLELKVDAASTIRQLAEPVIMLSEIRQADLDLLLSFLYNQVYKHPTVLMMAEKGKLIIEKLFRRFWENPELLPIKVYQRKQKLDNNAKAALILNYLVSLTDRQTMDLYEMMFTPYTKIIGGGFGK